MTHAETCRQICRIEPAERLAEVPLRRVLCVHGHSWFVTADGLPAPPPEKRGWHPAPEVTRRCAVCGHGPLWGKRRYCPPPAPCYREGQRARASKG